MTTNLKLFDGWLVIPSSTRCNKFEELTYIDSQLPMHLGRPIIMTLFKASAMTVNDKFTRYSWLDKICSRVRFGINNANVRNFKFVIYPNTLQCVIFVFERYQWVSFSSDGYRGDARRARALTLFLDQTEARRAAKMFFETIPPPPPLSEGLDPPLIIVVLLNPSSSM